MSYLPHLAVLAGIWALVVMSPGPDFVVTLSRAAGSRRAGLAAAAGIVLGTAIWASASAVGLALVLAHYRWIAEVVRLMGAGYLAWLGVRMIIHARRPLPPAAAAAGQPALGAAWRAGLLADLGNPKAAVFWTSLFATVLPPAAPASVHVAAITIAVAIAAAWYSAVACTFSLAVMTRWYRRAKKWVDRVTGGVLIGLAARLAIEH
jgi:threonine/homoserine/homoserine lactone efflux protein